MMPPIPALPRASHHKVPQAAQQNAAAFEEARRGVSAPLSDDEQLYCQYVESIVHLVIERREHRLSKALSFDFRRARRELRTSAAPPTIR